jgi:hypothetical protein
MAEKTILEEWKELLSDFNSNVDKSLKDIRQYKRDIEKMKVELLDEFRGGQFIRDEECIVISAPRIIIGNVTKDGNLREELGDVIIRGHALEMDGIGESGSIRINAPEITQRAIDTGIDGREKVVHASSEIIQQARNIVLDSQEPTTNWDYGASFLNNPIRKAGISLNAEKGISVMAAPANEKKKDEISNEKKDVDSKISDLKDDVSSKKKEVDALLKKISDALKDQEGLSDDDDMVRSNVLAIDEVRYTVQNFLPAFSKLVNEYAALLSELAELNRKKQNLKTEEDEVNSSADKYKQSTESSIYMQSERITMHSKDGDNTWRTNEGAGVDIRGNEIKLHSTQEDPNTKAEVLTPEEAKGKVSIRSRNVNISTADSTNMELKENDIATAQYPLVGNVTIRSKIIDLESVDLKQTDESGALVEEKLTEGSQINMRAEKVRVKTIDHEGKSVGKFSVNSQKISMKSTNIEGYKPELELDSQGNRKHPEKMKSKELAQGSKMLLLSENVTVGYKNEKIASKSVFVVGKDEILLNSDNQVELNTVDSALTLQKDKTEMLASSNVSIGSKAVDVTGETKMNSKLTAGDIVTDNLTANKAIKAPNLTDGVLVSGAAGQPKKAEKVKMEDNDL